MVTHPAVTALETLERRCLLSAVAPSDLEQYMLELVNRARANPSAEAMRHGIDLNEGLAPGTISAAAKQPVAMNPYLIDAARRHSQWMIANDVFSHTGVGGSNPAARMVSAGYGAANTFGWGENLAYRGQKPGTPPPTSTTAQQHADLFIDARIDGRGHRLTMLSADFKEVGVGIATGVYNTHNSLMSAQDFGYRIADSFLTGVAFDDRVTVDNVYTPGEGLGGVTISAVSSAGGAYSTTTWRSGGYSLQVPAGTYTLTASGGELASPVQHAGITIGSSNVKQDVRPGASPPVSPPPVSPPPVSPPTVPPVSPTSPPVSPTSPPVSPTSPPVPPTSPPVSPPVSPPSVPAPKQDDAIGIVVWNDLNADGKKQKREPGVAARTLFLDINGDGVRQAGEPATITTADGFAAFLELTPGVYQVRLEGAAGWSLTSAGGMAREVAVVGRVPKLQRFGLTETATLGGAVYADTNANMLRDDGEPPFRKAKVFFDLNGDGVRQKTERITRVAKDGSYRFAGLTPAIYAVRLWVGKKFAPTTPAMLPVDVSAPAAQSLGQDFGVGPAVS